MNVLRVMCLAVLTLSCSLQGTCPPTHRPSESMTTPPAPCLEEEGEEEEGEEEEQEEQEQEEEEEEEEEVEEEEVAAVVLHPRRCLPPRAAP